MQIDAPEWPHPDDVPTPAQVRVAARELLSPRAAAGLDALPASQGDVVARCVVAMHREGIPFDARQLEHGQLWPDVIVGTDS